MMESTRRLTMREQPESPALIAGAAALAALALALVPWLGPLAYPLRLLLTIVHELGHGLAALLTGGDFLRFIVFPDGSGVATTAGGWQILIIPAGYLTAAAFGALLIRLGRQPRAGRVALAATGILLLALTLRYGLPGLIAGGLLAVLAGLALGSLLLWAAARAPRGWLLFLLNLIGIQAGLTALTDLLALVALAGIRPGMRASDAHAMAALTGIPAIVWALLWAALAAVLVGSALWTTWRSRG
jgi:hypothetical protein